MIFLHAEGDDMRMMLKQTKDGQAVYAIQNLYRVVYGIFCVAIGFGVFTTLREKTFDTASIIPLLLFLVGLAGLTYRETWIFDAHRQIVRSVFGVAVFVKTTELPFDQIEALEINHFVRGRLQTGPDIVPKGRNKSMVVFSIVTNDNNRRDIEIISEKESGGKTEAAAKAIAEAMGFAFRADREYDNIQKMTLRDL